MTQALRWGKEAQTRRVNENAPKQDTDPGESASHQRLRTVPLQGPPGGSCDLALGRYSAVGDLLLRRLAHAVGQEAQVDAYLEVQRFLCEPWWDWPVADSAPYPSRIGDDHSPFEYSAAFESGRAELRLLFEAQAEMADPVAQREAALATLSRLEARYGLDLRRFDAVKDLFLPEEVRGPFTLWHAVTFSDRAQPAFKVYLCPEAHGEDAAVETICEALTRLGMLRASERLSRHGDWHARGFSQPNYFSLDMTPSKTARVKVYFKHPEVTGTELDEALRIAPSHKPGDVRAFFEGVLGHEGPMTGKPVTTCLSFVEGSQEPHRATVHLPVAHYLANDELVCERVDRHLASHLNPDISYSEVVRAAARRPLADQSGLQSYISFRREAADLRFTVYLSPELY